MLIEIQKTIPNVPYSMNRQSFEVTPEMTQSDIEKLLSQAKTVSDMVDRKWQEQVTLSPQEAGENEMLRKANEQLDLAGAQKSVLINALKDYVGQEKYEELRSAVISSDQFKSLTLHANVEE